jgi:hypothetical protein
MKPLTPEMKEQLLREKQAAIIRKKLDKRKRTKFNINRQILILPEDFTGGDLKRAKKLMKNKK